MAEHPRNIGRYQVQRLLGQGAMGSVYLAEDPMLKRRLAIKVVRAIGEERDLALDRFKREAEISAQLNHPNVVTIYDVGEEENLGPFLAMEYVEGQSLGKYIREGTLEPETRLGILIQAMRALRAAHRHAIIHRDIKPDNILVSEDGRIKLMDFGIAKTMAPRLTSQGEFLGSPAYSAPELLRGADPTPSSDRYAFGVTAFELMTGQLPHPGNNVAAVITHVLHEAIVTPQGMSGDLGNIFRKALATDPEDRYETLIEFLTALIDAYPLDSAAKGRVEDLFCHDDHSGDIVPLRRSRPRPSTAQDTGSGIAQRSTAGRSNSVRPVLTPTTAAVRIELESGQSTNAGQRPMPVRSGAPGSSAEGDGISPKTLLKWILIVLVFGPLVMWLLDILRTYIPQG
ncbi:MAG: serine/threonine-protein kinase [Holophaga sp.]|nr:serine/threonine-protein kinase [Holophaga sp.]